jgi:hypothetical protein
MALPAHLAKYDRLLDYLVEELVRELEEQGTETETPASAANAAGAISTVQEPLRCKMSHADSRGRKRQ